MSNPSLLQLSPLELLAINLSEKKEVYTIQIQQKTERMQYDNSTFESSFDFYWSFYQQKQAKSEYDKAKRILILLKSMRVAIDAMGLIIGKNIEFAKFVEQYEQLIFNYTLLANMFDVMDRMPPSHTKEYDAFLVSIVGMELPEVVKEDLTMAIELHKADDDSENLSYEDVMAKLKS